MKTIRSFAGANGYSHQPVVVLEFAHNIKEANSIEIAGFNTRLIETLPGLRKHFCNLGESNAFVRYLEKGGDFYHILVHIARELATLAGIVLEAEKIRAKVRQNATYIIFETTTAQQTARYILSFAAELLEDAATGKSPDITENVNEAKSIHAREQLDARLSLIVRAAERRGIPWSRQSEDEFIQLGYGANSHRVSPATKIDTIGDANFVTKEPQDIGEAIVETIYPNGKSARIPIIAITGTNGKTSVTRMTAHILAAAHLSVGMTTSTGIYLKGEEITKGDTTGPVSARTVLSDRAVEVAVLETARGGIVRRGLGYDWSDVSIITNISEDHIGQDGIASIADLIEIKALVAERVKPSGALIVNADDENALSLLEREKVKAVPKNIIYFSLDENNARIRQRLASGGTAYFTRNGFIVEAAGQETFPVVKIAEIPATLGGTAEFQTANAMAAIAGCRALNIAREICAVAMQSFRSDADNPGRNNLYKVGAGYVLVDYGHNTDGFAAICRMARRWTGKTVTGIIGLPGDRDDRIIEEAGRVATRGFDRVIVTEEVNRRGRAIGEMARLLCAAIERENPAKKCEIIFDEIEAFSKALAEMRKDEVVVIFYRQLDLILQTLERHNAVPVSSLDEPSAAN